MKMVMKMTMISSMSSVTVVALYTVPEMWVSHYDHRNSPRLLHWMSRVTHPHCLSTPLILQWISSLKVLLMDTEWKAWAVPSTVPLESVDGWASLERHTEVWLLV